jgi:hypothetical protein
MSAQFDVLVAQVHSNTTVMESALTFIQGLSQKLQDAINAGADPAVLQAMVDELKAEDDKMAAAIATVPAPAIVPTVAST